MDTPDTRREFERRFHLLQVKIERGELFFTSSVKRTLESLEYVRRLPNGRVDFLSVDETARLQANMMASMPTKQPQADTNQ